MKPPRIPPPPTRYGQAPAAAQMARATDAGRRPLAVPPPVPAAPARRAVPPPVAAATIQPSLSGRGAPRPSREDRDKDRLTKSTLKTTDKKSRTRAGKKAMNKLAVTLNQAPDQIRQNFLNDVAKNTAPRRMGMLGTGGAIYSGKWRGFEAEFEQNWWNDQGAAPWDCCICHAPILANGVGDAKRSIEHRKPWSSMKTEIATHMVCKDGVHWEVALTEDVRAVLQDTDNLEPAHQGCNSSKGGTKTTDSIAPVRRGDCPGGACGVGKAI